MIEGIKGCYSSQKVSKYLFIFITYNIKRAILILTHSKFKIIARVEISVPNFNTCETRTSKNHLSLSLGTTLFKIRGFMNVF